MSGSRLESLELWLIPGPGPLRPQVLRALAAAGTGTIGTTGGMDGSAAVLRWAITGVDPERGLRLEAVRLLSEP